MLIETAYHTGLRRAELSDLKVGDLQLSSSDAQLLVKHGKGGKDRLVYLNEYIRSRLAEFTDNMDSGQSVFGLAPKTISLKIGIWTLSSRHRTLCSPLPARSMPTLLIIYTTP